MENFDESNISKAIKFPRIYHLPCSPKKGADDKVLPVDYFKHFKGKLVTITAKLDGGNTCISWDGHIYARSHGGDTSDPCFSHLKAKMADFIPHLFTEKIDMYGENCYHRHTVVYQDLPDWFFVIGFRNRKTGIWFNRNQTVECAVSMGLIATPLLYSGTFDDQDLFEQTVRVVAKRSLFGEKNAEGAVAWVSEKETQFNDGMFQTHIAKYVNSTFQLPNTHWRSDQRVVNGLNRAKELDYNK